MRRGLAILVLLASVVAARADGPSGTAATYDEFRAGWREAASPALGHEGKSTMQARQEALLAAIPHFEAAVSAAPDNIPYRVSLAYALLSAGKYQQAKEALDQAIARKRDDPLLYLLRAQAEAALAYMNPETKAEEIGPALRSFDDAAHLEPENSLALIQAASVAFEVGKQEVALAKLEAGLKLPGMSLYRLPIPGDLGANQTQSIRMWQHLQMWQWMELLARCQNAARMMVKYGKQKEDAGDLDGADAAYRQVLALGRQVGNARPNLFVTVTTALSIMEDAYINLARVAEARKSPDAEQWKGETGVVYLGRQGLVGQLQAYTDRIAHDPPASIEAALELEAQGVAYCMSGVGLSPTHKPPRPTPGGKAAPPSPSGQVKPPEAGGQPEATAGRERTS